ncbi:MAG: M15 family metallopeptidase [Clostridium sp.]|jgi:D-alanyl-D-alanine carboxypeptidase|nr:M15 family metallopeptidase [Clostridium sp.]
MVKKLMAMAALLLCLALALAACGVTGDGEEQQGGTTDYQTETTSPTTDGTSSSSTQEETSDVTTSGGGEGTTSSTTAGAASTAAQGTTSTAAASTGKGGEIYPAYAQKYAYAGYTPQQTDMEPWNLMLLNSKYCLPEGYEVDTAAVGNGTYLDSRVLPYYQAMVAAAAKDGKTLTAASGWRRLSTQTSNLDASIASYQKSGYDKVTATKKALQLIMLPGCSEHNAGLAMDICTWSPSDHFENSGEYAWLMEHGAEYGFILRYPEDKVSITGVSFEPWHWRYVGKAAATEIMKNGVCLEEYLGK